MEKRSAEAMAAGSPVFVEAKGKESTSQNVNGEIVIDSTHLEQIKKARLYGRVFDKATNKPVSGVELQCVGSHADLWYHNAKPYSAVTDGDGNYEITGLPPDEYWLQTFTRFVSFAGKVPGGFWLQEGQVQRQDIPVEGSGVLEGHVLDCETKQPIAGIAVTLFEDGQYDCWGCDVATDQKGYFRAIGLKPKRYRLLGLVKDGGVYEDVQNPRPQFDFATENHIVTELLVRSNWAVNIRLVDTAGLSVPRVWITKSERLSNGDWHSLGAANTSDDGRVGFSITPKANTLRFEAAVSGLECSASAEVTMPSNRLSEIELRLPCALADLPPQPKLPLK